MDTHPTDPTALIAGLFFGFAGLAILADQQWEEVDVTAFTAAGVMLTGLLLLGLVIARSVRAPATPVSDTRYRDIADAADSGDRGGDEAGEPLGVEVGDEITVVGPGEVEGGTEELGVTDPEVG